MKTITLTLDETLKALLTQAREAKAETDAAYAQHQANGLAQSGSGVLFLYENAESQAMAALGRYILKQAGEERPS